MPTDWRDQVQFVKQADQYPQRSSDRSGDALAVDAAASFVASLPTVSERRDQIEWYEQIDPARYADLRGTVARAWRAAA